MTVSSITSRKDFSGSGSTGPFNISALGIQDETHISVLHLDAAGVETAFVLTTDYTVNSDLTEVTTVANVDSGETLTVLRAVPLTQTADYQANSAFPAEVNETALDKLTQITQELDERLDRTLQLPGSSTGTGVTMPEASTDKGLKWDASGNLVNTTVDVEQGAIDAAASAVAAATSETNAASSASAASTSATNAAADAVSTAADVVSTNADVVLTNADVVSAEAAASAVANPWTFDTSTSMADPGTGDIRLNNATVSSVTAIAVSAQTADTGNPDVSDFVATWDDSTNSANKGYISIKKSSAPATFAIFKVSGTVVDNTTWLQIPVTYVDNNGTLSASDKLHTQFTRTGDDGAGSLSNVVEDTTPQLGGDLDCNGAQIQWSHGADVASAAALPVLTDGNYFDVTGTTTVTSINTTGGDGTQIKLHFDGALILTHHATNLILPGGANITTAAGDEAEFLEYGAGTYRCTNYMKADGTPVVSAGGGSLVLLSTQTASAASTVSFTSDIDSTYKQYLFKLIDLTVGSDGSGIQMLVSTDGGSSYLATSVYTYHLAATNAGTAAYASNTSSPTGGGIVISASGGNASGENLGSEVIINNPASSTEWKIVSVNGTNIISAGTARNYRGGGSVNTTTAIDAIRFKVDVGTFSGTLKMYGVL